MKTYKQLTQEQRYQISALRKAGFNQSEIANQIEVNKSTVSRELRRNRGKRGYRPKQAHSTAVSRQQSVKKACTFTDDMRLFITEKIQEQWSPEQIHGYCKTEEIAMVSHETIYQFLLADKAKGGQLYVHLRCQRKRYKKRYGKVDTRGCIKNRVSIDERPQVVEKKKRVGDWEGDTVIGKNHQGVIVTLVDRVSKLALIKRVPNKSAEVVTTAIKALLKPYKEGL